MIELGQQWGVTIKVAALSALDSLDSLRVETAKAYDQFTDKLDRKFQVWLKGLDREIRKVGLLVNLQRSYVQFVPPRSDSARLDGEVFIEIAPTGVSFTETVEDFLRDKFEMYGIYRRGDQYVWYFGG